MTIKIIKGDCRDILKTLETKSTHCCITSPPYFGLRDYGDQGQIGLENSPEDFITEMVGVFREVRRVMRDDGTLWINLGDSYSGSGKGVNTGHSKHIKQKTNSGSLAVHDRKQQVSLPAKNLIGIPWRVAFALQADGWILRQDIIWSKPNPMPESVTDRCTKAHEYIFLLSKSPRYYFDQEAILEPISMSTQQDGRLTRDGYEAGRPERGFPGQASKGAGLLIRKPKGNAKTFRGGGAYTSGQSLDNSKKVMRESTGNTPNESGLRNKRTVWEVATQPFKEAHFATFPPKLIEPCILSGCPKGGTILDPFGGAGTTGLVADRLGRNAILIELNPEYADIARKRISGDGPLFAEVL